MEDVKLKVEDVKVEDMKVKFDQVNVEYMKVKVDVKVEHVTVKDVKVAK